jgi:hypothetical protein
MPKLKRPAAYNAETWEHLFTETERQELVKLYALRDAKYDEFSNWLSAELDNLDTPQTPHQRLLHDFRELGKAIQNIQDEACARPLGVSEKD